MNGLAAVSGAQQAEAIRDEPGLLEKGRAPTPPKASMSSGVVEHPLAWHRPFVNECRGM